jgi:hypothetical protein
MNDDNHDSSFQDIYRQVYASPGAIPADSIVPSFDPVNAGMVSLVKKSDDDADLRRENADLRRMLDYLLSYIAVVNSNAEGRLTPAFVVYGKSLEHDLAQSSVLNEIGYINVTGMPIIDVIRRVVDKRESSIEARRSALSTSYSENSNHEAIPNVQPRSDRGV